MSTIIANRAESSNQSSGPIVAQPVQSSMNNDSIVPVVPPISSSPDSSVDKSQTVDINQAASSDSTSNEATASSDSTSNEATASSDSTSNEATASSEATSDANQEEEQVTENDFDACHYGELYLKIGKVQSDESVAWGEPETLFVIHTTHKSNGQKHLMVCKQTENGMVPLEEGGVYAGCVKYENGHGMYTQSREGIIPEQYCVEIIGKAN